MIRNGDAGGPRDRDPFGHDDAAYLLGLLGDDERAAFEAHLAGCPDCARRIAGLAPAAGALGRLGPADWAALDEPPAPVPATLLPRLARLARRRRTRVRAALAGCAAVAAAAVAALVVVLAPGGGGGTPARPVAGQAMTAVPGAPIRASAVLTPTAWGTRVSVTCRYAAAPGGGYPGSRPAGTGPGAGGAVVYVLQVVDTAGTRHRLGSWTQAGQDVRFTGGVALPESRIGTVQVARPDGTALLTLPVG